MEVRRNAGAPVTCADAILTMPQPFERPVASSIITSALSTSPAVLKWSLSACHVTCEGGCAASENCAGLSRIAPNCAPNCAELRAELRRIAPHLVREVADEERDARADGAAGDAGGAGEAHQRALLAVLAHVDRAPHQLSLVERVDRHLRRG